jgi:2-methylcitrate dehydratase PrpD
MDLSDPHSAHPSDGLHGEDAADIISRHLAKTSYDDLPSSTIRATKASILDTLACMFAGSASADVQTIAGLATEWGGRRSSTVILGGGLKVPPPLAVLVNGAMIHQYDFDDTHDLAICHPTSATLPSALAMAESVGRASGKDLITAVALANDVVCRIALAIRGGLLDYPWFRAPVVGLFGTTVAATKIRGATEDQHRNGLGLTLPLVSSTLASLHHGNSSVRSIRDGLLYRNGVLAAELAMRGLRGDSGVFDGPYGYYQSFFRGEYDRGKLIDTLGERYETEHVSLKPWPSRRTLHRTITAVVDVMISADIHFDQIDHVEVLVGKITRPWCRPCSLGMVPTQRIDLLNNMLFAVGAAIRYRDVPLRLYNNPELADGVVSTAVPKVRWREVENVSESVVAETGHVKIMLTDGTVHEGTCEIPLGHPDRPLSTAELRTKILNCAENARAPLAAEKVDAIIETVMRMEELTNVAALAEMLI